MQPMVTLNNGVEMPVLGVGTWQLAEGVAELVVSEALAVGYRAVDTAAAYGNERGVGRAVRSSGLARSEVFLTTKLVDREGYRHTVESCHASLDRLGVEFLDLYLVHWPFDAVSGETWRALQDLYADGLVRAIGVSNYSAARLDRLIRDAEVVPAVNQIELHPRLTQIDLRKYCAAQGIAVESWSPLMQGGELLDHPVIRSVAEAAGRTAAQVILRWHVQHGLIVIPRSTNPGRLRENAALFDFELSAAQLRVLDGLEENRRASPLADPETYVFSDETYQTLQAMND
ncbi:MAG: aldo/keto reductase [Nocardia sp.]|uniref:aldo/keto reductase n=1 Tax=Nocardia sp. TaxID=1821 RepID=UPI002604DFE6|nr:aldo/keto reductase [Nocardia sp.]MCU1645486.1 aldo/keto reductase [Nocardia sp.]